MVISCPVAAEPVRDRDEFLAFRKAEWLTRQGRFLRVRSAGVAHEVGAAWWSRDRDRDRTVRAIGDARAAANHRRQLIVSELIAANYRLRQAVRLAATFGVWLPEVCDGGTLQTQGAHRRRHGLGRTDPARGPARTAAAHPLLF